MSRFLFGFFCYISVIFLPYGRCSATPKTEKQLPVPEFIGEIVIPSFLNASKNITETIEKASPESATLVKLSLATLSLKPEFKNIDQSKPLSFLAFKGNKGTTHWVTSFKLKSKKLNPALYKPFKYKYNNNRLTLADTEQLLQLADLHSTKHLPKHDILVRYLPEKYPYLYQAVLSEFQNYSTQKVLKQSRHTQETLVLIKILHILLAHTGQLLKDTHSLTIYTDFCNGTISSELSLHPTSPSPLKSFLASQSNKSSSLSLSILGNYTIFLQGSLILTPQITGKITNLIKDIYIETAEEVNQNLELIKTISFLLSHSNGHITAYANKHNFYIQFDHSSDNSNKIIKFLSETHKQTINNKATYPLTDNRSYNYYCKVTPTASDIFSTNLEINIIDIIHKDYLEKVLIAEKQKKKITIKTNLSPDRLVFNIRLPEQVLKKVFPLISPGFPNK